MSLTLITGIQAAGKSAVAQALAEQLPNSVHVRGDAFRRMIVNGRAEMSTDVLSQEAVRQLHLRYEVADRYAAAGFNVVLQDIILGDALTRVVERIRTTPLSVVVLVPSAQAVHARDLERQPVRGKVAYTAGTQGIRDLDDALRTETPRLGLWLDTSEMTVDETVGVILEKLETAALIRE